MPELSEWLNSVGIGGARDVSLFRQAFHHRSFKSGLASNERLEFLGDAVLELIITEYIMERYPESSEGFLTNLRSRLVCGKMLSFLSRRINIEVVLDTLWKKEDDAMEDALEALVGALFKDAGFNATRKWVLSIYEKYVDFASIIESEFTDRDRLIRALNRQGRSLETETLPVIDGTKVILKNDKKQVIGIGESCDKKAAYRDAYKSALRYIGEAV